MSYSIRRRIRPSVSIRCPLSIIDYRLSIIDYQLSIDQISIIDWSDIDYRSACIASLMVPYSIRRRIRTSVQIRRRIRPSDDRLTISEEKVIYDNRCKKCSAPLYPPPGALWRHMTSLSEKSDWQRQVSTLSPLLLAPWSDVIWRHRGARRRVVQGARRRVYERIGFIFVFTQLFEWGAYFRLREKLERAYFQGKIIFSELVSKHDSIIRLSTFLFFFPTIHFWTGAFMFQRGILIQRNLLAPYPILSGRLNFPHPYRPFHIFGRKDEMGGTDGKNWGETRGWPTQLHLTRYIR